MARGRRRFTEDGLAEPVTDDAAPEPTPPPAPSVIAKPVAPTGRKVLLRQKQGKPHAHYLPLTEPVAFRICVDSQYYEHVAEDEAGCWIYARS